MGAIPQRLGWLTLLVTLCSGPALAEAQTNVVVLGLSPIDGDAEVARNLTGALKHAASQNPDWRVSEREVSLAQMSIAHGCQVPNASCLAEIAETLTTQALIYGTVGRSSTGDQYDYTVELRLFNAQTGAIEHTLTDRIPRGRSDIDDMRPVVMRYINELAGATPPGTLRIQVNVPDAPVMVDGQALGSTDAGGALTDYEILGVVCHERYTLGGAEEIDGYEEEFEQWCSEESPLYEALEAGESLLTLEEVDDTIIPIGLPAPGQPGRE